jgi:hypothetical protein
VAAAKVEVDGEPGFSVKMAPGVLGLRKGELHVRMRKDRIKSVSWEKRYRYGKLMLYIGIALLVALGVGLLLILLYRSSRYDALVIKYGKGRYGLSGDRELLERVRLYIEEGKSSSA